MFLKLGEVGITFWPYWTYHCSETSPSCPIQFLRYKRTIAYWKEEIFGHRGLANISLFYFPFTPAGDVRDSETLLVINSDIRPRPFEAGNVGQEEDIAPTLHTIAVYRVTGTGR